MSAPISLIAIIELNPGKLDRFMELFEKCAAHVKENEPFVLKYELSQGKTDPAGEVTDVVVQEIYEDKAAVDKHMAGEPIKVLMEANEKEGLAKSMKVIFTNDEAKTGFASRL